MTTFARIKNNLILDPQRRDTADAWRSLYAADVVSAWEAEGWVITEIIDGVQHGATDRGPGYEYERYANPDGTFLPPTPRPPEEE